MRIILSPAKKMNMDTDTYPTQTMPQFLSEAEKIKKVLQNLSNQDLQALWGCNDKLAALNIERLDNMDLQRNLTPALFSYEGIAYQYMAPNVFELKQLHYVEEHLRILSGFYGMLRPLDGVTPYRLEMQTKLSFDGHKNLYAFWGNRLANQLAAETNFVLNLASKEYSKAVAPHLPGNLDFVTCTFAENKDGKLVEKGTLCKMARGHMVRWLAENSITTRVGMQQFEELGYHFSKTNSTATNDIFIKE